MTDTTTERPARVYVRRLGYATVRELHPDHSATVRFETDGTEDRIPFGDWSYDPADPATAGETGVTVSYRIRERLQRDLGDSFAEVSSGVGPGVATWFTAKYGPYVVNVTVTPES